MNTPSPFRSFHFLNGTQFLGILNENIFKLLIVFFLIQLKGPENIQNILSAAGIIFVLPFLLFSSIAGILADRLSKQKILVYAKRAELCFVFFSIVAFFFQSELFLYLLLFLLATTGAFFGPSKYGIIPELLAPKNISLANGILTASTFLAMIFGTFLASFITDITHKNFFLSSLFCIFISCSGLFLSLRIPKTTEKKSEAKISLFFPREIYKTLLLSKKTPHLFPAILGSAFFLSIGSFTQLNAIPFAMESLHLSEVGGTYIFLATALGIVGGSFLAGKISKDQDLLLGLSLVAGLGLSIFLILLGVFANYLFCDLFLFVILGICGGLFLIPFDSFLQLKSPETSRGQVIATGNFLSFCGVFLSSFCLYFFHSFLHFSAATSFSAIGVLTLLFTLYLIKKLPDVFFPFIAQKILFRNFFPKAQNVPSHDGVIFLKKNSSLSLFAFLALFPHAKIFTPRNRFTFPLLHGLLSFFDFFPKNFQNKQLRLCLKKPTEKEAFEKLFSEEQKVFYATCEEEKFFSSFLKIPMKRRQFTIVFSEKQDLS